MLLAITWGLVGLLLGLSAFIVVPWTLAILGGVDVRDRVGRYYIKQMQTVLGDTALVAREQGGVALTTVSFDPEFSADRVTVGGETGHLMDTLNAKSRLSGKPFGIGLESHGEYITPLIAEFAEYASDAKHDGRLALTDGGARLDFEIPAVPTIPELRGAHRILDGDARRRFGVLSESWAQKSQEKFGQRISLGQTLILMAAFAVGSGMAILTMKYGTGGGGGGVEVPIQIARVGVGA
ncbi:hypothetical protein AFNJKBDN_CDS0004 [Halorubrum virus V_ICIS4]|nr:hypothetical protein AFNJKBDN_CDS0004 [Halorubrum virus V_ICIS4]